MRLPFLRPKTPADRNERARHAAPIDDAATVEAARTRARRRLVGALVLLVVAVAGFPVLFETQPRPLAVDTPIEAARPSGNGNGNGNGNGTSAGNTLGNPAPVPRPVTTAPELPPLAATADSDSPAAVPESRVATAQTRPVPTSTPAAQNVSGQVVTETAARPTPATQAPASTSTSTSARAEAVAAPKPPPAMTPGTTPATTPATAAVRSIAVAPAAIPTPPPAAAASASGRFVVQVGAYSDAATLRDARAKAERLGLKTYTQVVDTPGGQRTRVRLGPFVSRDEADAVATKVKRVGLPANILAL